MGLFVMDEADLETHGACCIGGYYQGDYWREYGENEIFTPGIADRHTALVERDKNRPCVIMWSLGNEAAFGKAFFEGARYIKNRDKTRPVHYEGLQNAPNYYYTDLVDVVSMMYPSVETIREKVQLEALRLNVWFRVMQVLRYPYIRSILLPTQQEHQAPFAYPAGFSAPLHARHSLCACGIFLPIQKTDGMLVST